MNPNTLLVLGLAGATCWYAVACLIWPYASCGRCEGGGKLRSPSGRTWRACPRCAGTGRRLRIGRHMINRWKNTGQRAR